MRKPGGRPGSSGEWTAVAGGSGERLEPAFGLADCRERCAKHSGALLFRQIGVIRDREAGGTDVGIADHTGRECGQRLVAFDHDTDFGFH